MKPLESPILPRYPNDNSGQAYYRSMDYGHVMRTFFKNVPNNWDGDISWTVTSRGHYFSKWETSRGHSQRVTSRGHYFSKWVTSRGQF